MTYATNSHPYSTPDELVIQCVVCERWLELDSFPTLWNEFNNICDDCCNVPSTT